MKNRPSRTFLKKTLATPVILAIAIAAAQAGEPIFVPVKIDGPKHDPPNHTGR